MAEHNQRDAQRSRARTAVQLQRRRVCQQVSQPERIVHRAALEPVGVLDTAAGSKRTSRRPDHNRRHQRSDGELDGAWRTAAGRPDSRVQCDVRACAGPAAQQPESRSCAVAVCDCRGRCEHSKRAARCKCVYFTARGCDRVQHQRVSDQCGGTRAGRMGHWDVAGAG